ncbi:hypothetical protein D6S11_16055 [Salmonella enterica subsp. enterica]|nr:hypothetical protein [Salmonella enterica subsp. enterica serovar Isaszeg]
MISRSTAFWQKLRRWWPFYIMALPGVIYFFIWHYLPIWEAKIAFEQYRIFDQVFNMTNDVVNSQIDIIDTYVYRMGLRTGEFSLATAAGLFKGVIGMILIVLAHTVSKRLTGKGVW